jgi:hypothetical protein
MQDRRGPSHEQRESAGRSERVITALRRAAERLSRG